MPALEFTKLPEINPYKNVSGYDPAKIEVDPAKDTVQGQVADIVQKDSPVMTLARTGAKQQSAKRGLLNTSMAAGAGEKAVLETAMPMAQQDAATNYEAKKVNAGAENDASARALQGRQNMEGTAAQGYENRLIQDMRNDVDLQLQQIRTQADMITGATQSMGQAFSAANIAIGEILSNPDIPAGSKQALVDKVLAGLNNQMAWVGKASGLDFSDTLVFPGSDEQNTDTTTPTSGYTGGIPDPSMIPDWQGTGANSTPMAAPNQTQDNAGYTDDQLRETIRMIKAEDTSTDQKIAKLAGVITSNNIDPQRVADILGVPVADVVAQLG